MGITQGVVETEDLRGSTDHYNGTVGTTPVSIPSSPGNAIQSVLIDNVSISANKKLLVSFDSGTTWKTIPRKAVLQGTIKGAPKQIQVKGSVAGVEYEIILNRED